MALRLLSSANEAHPGDSLSLALVNAGPGGCSFGHEYWLERQEAEQWVRCNVEEAWPASLLTRQPGGRFTWIVELPQDGLPGTYRVRKQVATAPGQVANLTFEFTVAQP